MTANGKRLFITMNMAGKVVMLDTTDPAAPKLVKALDLGKDSGPHYLALTRGREAAGRLRLLPERRFGRQGPRGR
jgi:hypothetical protein